MYCIDDDSITLKTFGFDGENNEILNLRSRRAAKINTSSLNEILISNFKTYTDKSGGSVAFVKNCNTLDTVQESFLKHISDMYTGISIKNLNLQPQGDLLDNLKLKEISLSQNTRSNGTFRAVFELSDFSTKSIFFKYSFDALMPVFIALNDIDQKKILNILDYTKTWIDFNKFDRGAIINMNNTRLIAKTNIKSGEILLTRHFAQLSLVNKGDRLNAIIKDGSLSISTEVTALNGGNLSDIISVRTKDNKIYKATISSKKEVIIR